MTRIALDTRYHNDVTIHEFDVTDISEIADTDKLYSAFESGWPVIIRGLVVPGVDYDYYDGLEDWVIDGNKWIMPWYNSHIKARDRLRTERGWTEQQIDVFHKKHKQSTAGWEQLFDTLFPRYNAQNRLLSHRYNMLIDNKLHVDELDEQHTGEEQQIRMFVQLDKKRPRILTIGPTLEQLYRDYADKFNLHELDRNNPHTFVTEMRNRCVWNKQGWDQFHHPAHYISMDPGEIWFINAQWITHQIVFGAKLQCYEADITKDSMLNPKMCLAERIRDLK
jgi:hypothetical protein